MLEVFVLEDTISEFEELQRDLGTEDFTFSHVHTAKAAVE